LAFPVSLHYPLGFCLRSYVKDRVYWRTDENLHDLGHRIRGTMEGRIPNMLDGTWEEIGYRWTFYVLHKEHILNWPNEYFGGKVSMTWPELWHNFRIFIFYVNNFIKKWICAILLWTLCRRAYLTHQRQSCLHGQTQSGRKVPLQRPHSGNVPY
jgi:hypothetical protein